jgi:lipopolysaccharide transport system ATP-binding protein
MSEVIKVEKLSKIYDLGLIGTGTLSKDINRTWAKLLGKTDPYAKLTELNDRTAKSESGTVYALKDINFSVEKGEVLGIIGKNGAGKSTLLKILSQITSPSSGEIKIKGRVASLLEVGTGMHPEMTARQNIYLNGSIMGMRRHEITRKLDEIVDFAGITKYVDTPIKRFSSGMQVRLGFAVAAFLEPEILIVDEVLAVGDAEFQKKAIGKMQDVSKGEGRTVLFVSHNLASMSLLCNKGILIEKGFLTYNDDINNVISKYTINKNDSKETYLNIPSNIDRIGTGEIIFTRIDVYSKSTGEEKKSPTLGESLFIEVFLNNNFVDVTKLQIDIGIDNSKGQRIVWISTSLHKEFKISKSGSIIFLIEKLMLNKGYYSLTLFCMYQNKTVDWLKNVYSFYVNDGIFYETAKSPPPNQNIDIFIENKIINTND